MSDFDFLFPMPGTGESSREGTPFDGDAPRKGFPLEKKKKQKRQVVSIACLPCRDRKSKCDGGKPTCDACRQVYLTTCRYDLDADFRRKGALKRRINDLQVFETLVEKIRTSSKAESAALFERLQSSDPTLSAEAIAEELTSYIPRVHQEASLLEPVQTVEDGFEYKEPGTSLQYGITSNRGFDSASSNRFSYTPGSPVTPSDEGDWTTVTSDAEFIQHLLDLYFTWSHPWFLLFSEELFFHALKHRKPKYCTPLLVNAVLAVGCLYSDRLQARKIPDDPSTVGDQFFDEAKRLLEAERGSSLTTVQALGLMYLHEAASCRDESSLIYINEMMGMAVRLGLHISHGLRRNDIITDPEIAARKITFWGCFILETASAICDGRRPLITNAAIRLQKPPIEPELDRTVWRPHGIPEHDAGSLKLVQASMKYSFFARCIVLSEIANDITRLFYAPEHPITDAQLLESFKKLQKWHEELPHRLALPPPGSPVLPQVLTLHIYYYNCVIQIFRPFSKTDLVMSNMTPRQICSGSANEISRLIRLYSRTFGLRRTTFIHAHCLSTAARIHIVPIASHTPTSINMQPEVNLAEAIRGLHEIEGKKLISGGYLSNLQVQIQKFCPEPPAIIKQALSDTCPPSPLSATSNSPNTRLTGALDVKIEKKATNGSKETIEDNNGIGGKDASGIDLVQDEMGMGGCLGDVNSDGTPLMDFEEPADLGLGAFIRAFYGGRDQLWPDLG